jgi:Bacterial aa3 type cytochrome c oxidase subunit IV
MAEHLATDVATDADFAEHVRTYRLFCNLFKYALVGIICALIILAIVTL